jgi:soluble cytochrome b562
VDISLNRQTNPEVAMKYRDGLLEKLIPKKIEQKVEGGTDVKFSFQEGLQALFAIAQRTDQQLLPGLLSAVKKLEDKS